MPAPPIRAVAFDLDGLMFNTEDLYDEVIGAVLASRQREFSLETKQAIMGLPGPLAVAAMQEQCDLLHESTNDLLHEIHVGLEKLLPTRLQRMPGLTELLEQITKLNLPASIATSSPPEFVTTVLQLSQLADQFQFFLTSQDVPRGKPHPDIYLLSAERHGVAPNQMLVLEDSQNGSRAAAASGAFTVAVPGKHSLGLDFSHADLILESLADPALSPILQGAPE